jgi:pimeloyl-ACP methyl ester carboxylesterase
VSFDLHFVPPGGAGGVPLLLFTPPGGARPAPVLVCVHGLTRQPLDQLEAFAPLARAHGFALALPLFRDRGEHRRYQQLRHARRGSRADLALLHAIDAAGATHGLDTGRLHCFGYSGGAQFVHRLALLHPRRVASLGIGAAGWYTWPDRAEPWPHGLADAEATLGVHADLRAFFGLRIAVWVGERDDRPDEALRDEPRVVARQGSGRLERARRWTAAVARGAVAEGLRPDVRLEVLPRAGHDFLACHRRAGLADRVVAHALGRGTGT